MIDANMNFHTKWSIARGVLDPQVLTIAREFLFGQMQCELSRIGCPEEFLQDFNPVAISKWCKNEISSETNVERVAVLRGQFPAETRLSPKIEAVGRNIWEAGSKNGGFFQSVYSLGFRYLHLPPMARFVLPGNSEAGVPPHYDFQYNDHMSQFANVWVPLVSIDDKCGGVTVFEGPADAQIESADVGSISSGAVRQWHRAVPVEDMSRVDCQPMAPGDILTFGSNVLHGSMGNFSNLIRFSMEFRFLPELGYSKKPVFDFYADKKIDSLT